MYNIKVEILHSIWRSKYTNRMTLCGSCIPSTERTDSRYLHDLLGLMALAQSICEWCFFGVCFLMRWVFSFWLHDLHLPPHDHNSLTSSSSLWNKQGECWKWLIWWLNRKILGHFLSLRWPCLCQLYHSLFGDIWNTTATSRDCERTEVTELRSKFERKNSAKHNQPVCSLVSVVVRYLWTRISRSPEFFLTAGVVSGRLWRLIFS